MRGDWLYLDDMRPCPVGFILARTVDEAKEILLRGNVERVSLDHDLGACNTCLRGRSPEQWLEEHDYQQMPNCEHFGTGFSLLQWMNENGYWPSEILVHTANKEARYKMLRYIEENR